MRPIPLALLCLPLLLPGLAARAAEPAAVEQGHELFNVWCVGCHRARVKNENNPQSLVQSVVAGTYTLEQRYKGSKPAALEERNDLSPKYIESVVRHGLNLMPRTRKTELSDADVAAISAYLTRNNATRGRPR